MRKKMRKDIFNLFGSDKTLKLYDPYFRIYLLPVRNTFTGRHSMKLCVSVGRRFNPEKAKEFLSKNTPQAKRIAKLLAEELKITPEQVIEYAKDGTLKRFFVEVWDKTRKALDIPVFTLPIKKKASYEVYEMFKTNNVGEIFQLWIGITKAMGVAIKYFGSKEDYEKYQRKMMELLPKLLKMGLEE